MLTTSASLSPIIFHFLHLIQRAPFPLSQAQAATVHSLVSSLISQLCQLSREEITMAATAEVVSGKCFPRFLFSRAYNYQDLLKASNFPPQKTLRSTKVVIPYLDRQDSNFGANCSYALSTNSKCSVWSLITVSSGQSKGRFDDFLYKHHIPACKGMKPKFLCSKWDPTVSGLKYCCNWIASCSHKQ